MKPLQWLAVIADADFDPAMLGPLLAILVIAFVAWLNRPRDQA